MSLLIAIYKARPLKKERKMVQLQLHACPSTKPKPIYHRRLAEVAYEVRILAQSAPDRVDPDKTPAEDFIVLNRAIGRSWRLSPMSPHGSKFVILSEDDLVRIFWKDETVRKQLQLYAHSTVIKSVPEPGSVAQDDVVGWLKNLDSEELINRLLADIGGFTKEERRKKKHWPRSAHPFNSKVSYSGQGYALRGSVKTNGSRIQLRAFKQNELKCVQYR
ncbi:hypothetical protein BGX27_002521 [Mortierella sp. AM989]|nr:hypothetical protein BGX27_002521 [Mortierella sp. AM989]